MEEKRNFIAEVLQAQRAAGVTNEEICQGTTLTEVTLINLRRGQSNVQLRTVEKLANYFQWGAVEVGMAIWYADILDLKKKGGKKKK